ncbi:hypothetical protein ACFLZ8_04245 [Planctomycetota bacterium]
MKKIRRAHRRKIDKIRKLRKQVLAAGIVAAITFPAGAGLNKAIASDSSTQPDNHQLVVTGDSDSDLLGDTEEAAIGYNPFKADQNQNETPDGVELARLTAGIINELQSYIPGSAVRIPNRTYKIHHAFFGLEQCSICAQQVNMGGWEIINPNLNLTYPDTNDTLDGVYLPELAVHYMEHGSFDCFGDIHAGRVNVPLLLRVIESRFPVEPNEHRLAVDGNDFDSDLLTDKEELAAGYNLYDADQNQNLTPDGIDLAQHCVQVIEALPIRDPNGPEIAYELYKESFMQRGLENCDVCGEAVNMGFWRITNQTLGTSIDIPEITRHYMEHGSFSYSGDVHGSSRLNVALLAKILRIPSRCGDLGTIYSPADLNTDCMVDITDLTMLLNSWLKHSGSSQGSSYE